MVARAAAAGVTRMVTICTRLRQADAVRAIAEAHAGVFWAAGSHPLHVHEEPMATVEALVALARHRKLVGIGETGLDYHYSAETAGAAGREPARPRRGRAPDRPAADHPRPRRRRRHRPHPRRGARGRAVRLRHALLHLRPGAGRDRALARLLPVDLRHRDLPQRRRPARDLRRRAARPAAGRDRQPLPRAAAAPRPPQRAGLCRRHRADHGRAPRARPGRARGADLGELRPAVREGRGDDGAAARDHPRLRLLGRRAADRRRLGRLRPGRAEEPAQPLLRCSSSASATAAPRGC